MTPAEMARLHAQCFGDAPRPWSATEFTALTASAGCILLQRPQALLLGRVAADEAELLTLAVAPGSRRRGLGRLLAAEFAATSRAHGATTAFLEVAADNHPAKALYASLGWHEAGRRPHYYGAARDALILRLGL